MAFPDSFVDEVRRAADIVRVISEHMTLRKMGTSWKGLCPFHQEKTPSFNVRSEPAIFHCFGCGAGGDVFKFLMLFERVSFPEAVEALARRHSIAVPESRYEVGPDRKEREELLAVMEAAAQHFERTLWTAPGAKAREYLLGRGFKKETLEKIRAGATPRLVGRPPGRAARQVLAEPSPDRGPRARAAGEGRPVRPLPQPRDVLDPERVGQGRGLRRALPRRQRAQVPELSGDPRLPEEPHPLRPLLGQGEDPPGRRHRPDGRLSRRGARPRGRDHGSGRDLRHRAHHRRTPDSSTASRSG